MFKLVFVVVAIAVAISAEPHSYTTQYSQLLKWPSYIPSSTTFIGATGVTVPIFSSPFGDDITDIPPGTVQILENHLRYYKSLRKHLLITDENKGHDVLNYQSPGGDRFGLGQMVSSLVTSIDRINNALSGRDDARTLLKNTSTVKKSEKGKEKVVIKKTIK